MKIMYIKSVNTILVGAVLGMPATVLGNDVSQNDTYVLTIRHSEEFRQGDLSSGSSSGTDTLIERVLERSVEGVKLEYSQPARGGDQPSDWHFPALIFRSIGGDRTLVNEAEVEARLGPWLDEAELESEFCGRWLFTWNAFKVDCDPSSVLATTAAFDMWSFDLAAGSVWREADGRRPGRLEPVEGRDDMFEATIPVEPEVVRRAAAHSDVVIGEITGKPVSRDQALRAHRHDEVTGSIRVTIESKHPPMIDRLVRETQLTITRPGEQSEVRSARAVITREAATAQTEN